MLDFGFQIAAVVEPVRSVDLDNLEVIRFQVDAAFSIIPRKYLWWLLGCGYACSNQYYQY